MDAPVKDIEARVSATIGTFEAARDEIGKVIVGQRTMVDRLLIGLLSNGHVLLEGLPGLAKTTAVKALSDVLHLDFSRVQFTPDLLPADVVGTQIYEPKSGGFATKQGPIFANIVLADEINRAPAKVQSALLEAMQERQVTIGDTTFRLPRPFLVLATQNPIEQEGTYALPEAQVDRFLLKLHVDYPTRDEELEVLMRSGQPKPELRQVATIEQIIEAQQIVSTLHVHDVLAGYILDLVRATREASRLDPQLGRWIEVGASPRASIALASVARAHAYLDGRGYVLPEDVKAMAPDVLRHRVLPTYEAEADGVSRDDLIKRLLDLVEMP